MYNNPPAGISKSRWNFLLAKKQFEVGYGLTNYVKYVIALFGISSLDVSSTMLLAVGYAVACFVIGYIWFEYKFIEIDNEIGNQFNWFTKEMREMKTDIIKELKKR